MFGLGSNECSYRIVASGPYWRLRHYGAHDTPDPLLIIAAPIKRPYIWDLAPLGECDPKLPSAKIGCTFTGVAVRIPTHRQQRP
jgi:hypothetical protein